MERGPVEVLFVTYPRDEDVQRVVGVLRRPVDSGHVSVIDLVMFVREGDGRLDVRDAEDDLFPGPAFAGLRLDPHRLLSDRDLDLLAETLPPGRSGVAIVVEHVWARSAASVLEDLGAELAFHTRISPDVVDAAFTV